MMTRSQYEIQYSYTRNQVFEARVDRIEFRLKFDIITAHDSMYKDERGFLRGVYIKFDDAIWTECQELGLSRETAQALARRYMIEASS